MALVTMTNYFSTLGGSTSNLLYGGSAAVINIKTATSLVFTIPSGQDFAGYRISIAGGVFIYDGRIPIGGMMSSLVVRDQ